MSAQKTYKVAGQWKGKSAGGCFNHPTWRFNPQLFLSVERRKTVKITLTQEGPEPFHIGFYVAESDNTNRRQLLFSKSDLIGRAGFLSEPSVENEVVLHSSKVYTVIPCTFRPLQEARFYFNFQCKGTLKIAPLPPNKEWKWVTGKGEWKGKTAGGCRNHPSCVDNPQFLLRTKKATAVTILLSQTNIENFDAMGLYILKGKSSSHKLSRFRAEYFIAKSDFVRGPEACLSLTLESKSKYVILPCTFEPFHEGSFSVTVFSEYDVKVKPLKDAKEVSIQSRWAEGEAGGCVNYATWRNNPQFFLIMEKSAKISITLEQSAAVNESIGFYVTKSNGSQVIILHPESLLVKTTFLKQRQVVAECTLEKSDVPYVIIPCTFHAGVEMKFTLSICVLQLQDPLDRSISSSSLMSSSSSSSSLALSSASTSSSSSSRSTRARAKKVLQLVPCSSEWRRKSYQGYWVGNFRGGCINEKHTWLQNPQFSLSVSEKSNVAIIITQIQPENVIGFYVFKIPKPPADPLSPAAPLVCRLTESPSASDLVCTSQFPKGAVEASSECELDAGLYIIVACTFQPNRTGAFELTVYVENEVTEIDFLPAGNDLSFVKLKEPKLINVGYAQWEDIQLVEKIGQGGFGVVYKGLWKGGTVAVKKLFCDNMEDKEYDGFQQEIELMSKLNHKNILGCLGASLQTNSFLLTEFMDRGNLSDVLRAQPDLPWRIKIRMALDAAEGMNYLHNQKPLIVHRDLKSLNLLVNNEYVVKVADFGLSKTTTGKSLNSKVGSLNWCAPEILLKRMPFTPKSDVYSFGMVLFELITHHPPFEGCNPLQVVRAIDQGDLPSLPADTQEDLAQLVEDCWKAEPEDRPDFEEIIRRLKQINVVFGRLEDYEVEEAPTRAPSFVTAN